MGQVLEREWEVFEQQRARLLEEHAGKFVLIHGEEIVGVFESRDVALRAGYKRFGMVPLLVHEITAEEKPNCVITHTFAC